MSSRTLKSLSHLTETFKNHQSLTLCGHWLAAKANVEVAERILRADSSSIRLNDLRCRNVQLHSSIALVFQSNPKLPDVWPNYVTRLILNKE